MQQSFNTQPPEGGWRPLYFCHIDGLDVSTHSRLKAAGMRWLYRLRILSCFNTQPPEGGWIRY